MAHLTAQEQGAQASADCSRCGARRVDSQLGLEPTPEQYVENMVAVFREVRRVLRDDGSLWLNLGDSFGWPKPKDLAGIPWAVAEALREPYYTGRIRDERDRIWLAAMIDAEGCMFIHRRKAGQLNGQGYVRKSDSFGAGLEVSSTDRVIVERCMAITGLGSICEQSPEQNKRRKQTIYRWNLRSNVCREVVREVYPYLTAKQHEARLLIDCPSSGPKATAAWESLKAIHQGGERDVDFPAPASMFEPGYYLRSDIIWAKPSPMPESVTDRPTKAHEYLFLLTKGPRYFYDADAIRESATYDGPNGAQQSPYAQGFGRRTPEQEAERRIKRRTVRPGIDTNGGGQDNGDPPHSRNKRSVWTVTTQPFPGAHFATFPPKLIEPCILAGSPPKCCGECGAPWERVVVATAPDGRSAEVRGGKAYDEDGTPLMGDNMIDHGVRGSWNSGGATLTRETAGWRATCDHDDDSGTATVLDPFNGAGTTGLVALRHDRDYVGIELNPEYAQMARDRITDDAPLLNVEAA